MTRAIDDRAIDDRAIDDQASYVTKQIVEPEQNDMKAAASEQGFSREKKWRLSGSNQNNFNFLGVLFKSPSHTGLVCAKHLATNISCSGPFKF